MTAGDYLLQGKPSLFSTIQRTSPNFLLPAIWAVTGVPNDCSNGRCRRSNGGRIVDWKRESDVVGIAGVRSALRCDVAVNSSVQFVVDKIAQPWAGRGPLRQASFPRRELCQQICSFTVPADEAEITSNRVSCGRGKEVDDAHLQNDIQTRVHFRVVND